MMGLGIAMIMVVVAGMKERCKLLSRSDRHSFRTNVIISFATQLSANAFLQHAYCVRYVIDRYCLGLTTFGLFPSLSMQTYQTLLTRLSFVCPLSSSAIVNNKDMSASSSSPTVTPTAVSTFSADAITKLCKAHPRYCLPTAPNKPITYVYGTAGFRAVADTLYSACVRMGFFATFLSRRTATAAAEVKSPNHHSSSTAPAPKASGVMKAVGIMVTASHNEEKDNGMKLISSVLFRPSARTAMNTHPSCPVCLQVRAVRC